MAAADNDISGKVALITGASGGIGAAIARSLWQRGTSLALTYSSNGPAVMQLTDELKPVVAGQKHCTFPLDVSKSPDVETAVCQIESMLGRRPDILVSNAGYGKRISLIEDIPVEEFDKMITVNLRAGFLLAKYCVPHMKENQWGRIVFVSSIAAQGGGINGCHYAASKAGVQGLMRNLAARYAGDGITVNDVSPAMIGDTGMVPNAEAVAGTAGDVRNIPVGRLGEPREVANVVAMFCETGYMTGQSVLLSGGLK